jgi:hypothetical protein
MKVMEAYTRNPSINLEDIIIAEESKMNDISNILTFDMHFEKLGLQVVFINGKRGFIYLALFYLFLSFLSLLIKVNSNVIIQLP